MKMKKIFPTALSDLKKGQKAIIKGFRKEEDSFRLIEMGIFPGVEIQIVFSSFFGGPIYVNYNNGISNLLLNKEQASLVLIR